METKRSGWMKVLLGGMFVVALSAQARDLASIKQTGILEVANSGAYPPFSFVDPKGEVVGFDVDIAKAVAKKMGVTAKVITAPWSGMVPALVAGKFDVCICSMAITPEREKAIDFTKPYWHSHVSIWVKDNAPIQSLADLKGKAVGSTLGETANEWAVKNGNWSNQTYQGLPDLLMALYTGRVDAIVADDVPVYISLKNKHEAIRKINVGGLPENASAISLKQGEPELKAVLQKALDEIVEDGTYKKITDKWVGVNIR